VFTGEDPANRLQFGWTGDALVATEYQDGNVVADARMKASDLPARASLDSQLVFELKDGLYRTRFYNPEEDSYWDMGTQRMDPSFTRVGLLAYSNDGSPATAGFDRFEVF
jgi:hypothetical protein